MTTALATMETQHMESTLTTAKQLATSGLIPKALQGKPGDVLVVLLTGREFGLGPMQSLRGIHVVDGKAVMSADLIVGLCARERSVCEFFRLVESSGEVATYETKRAGHPTPAKLSFTIKQAQAAGLTGKQNWRNYPDAMLRARCAAALARAVYPDLVAGVYDPDEMEHSAPVRSVAPPAEPPAQTLSRAEPEDAQVEEPAKPSKKASAIPVVKFGSLKNQPLHSLTAEQLGVAMDEGHALLADDSKKSHHSKISAALSDIEAEQERRQSEAHGEPGAAG